jgi:hypothetical protein
MVELLLVFGPIIALGIFVYWGHKRFIKSDKENGFKW